MVALLDLLDGTSVRRHVDSTEILGAVALPSYYEAGALANRPMTDTAPCDYRFIVVAPASQRLLRQSTRVEVSLTANSKTFAQMLAKIALGVAVAKLGVTGFEPFVQNFILNNPNEYGIGSVALPAFSNGRNRRAKNFIKSISRSGKQKQASLSL